MAWDAVGTGEGSRQAMRAGLTAVLVIYGLIGFAQSPDAADRHTGYYYPAPKTQEVYQGRAQVLPESNRRTRVGFVTAVTACYQQATTIKPNLYICQPTNGAEEVDSREV